MVAISQRMAFFLMCNIFLVKLIKTDDYEYKLVQDLLKSYNKLARPSLNHLMPTNVTFDLSLSQLIDVDEKNQLITTNAWVKMEWVDYKLTWNESEYGGITDIRLPFDMIWKPDVILYNNADALASMAQISTHMIILSNGSITWLSTSIYRSSCSIDVQYFPFDQQNCSLSFASWTYDGNSLNLLKSTPDNIGDTSNYLQNGEWNLNRLLVERHVKVYSCCPNPYPNVTYYIELTRRPLFYVFNMILPSFLITLVGFLGFLIPPDSGEKIGMGVTSLLSMTVFLMAISDTMPPNSDSIPLIATYYFSSMFIISLGTAGTVVTLNIFKRGENDDPVPEIIQKIFFDVLAKCLFIRVDLNRDLHTSFEKIYARLKTYYIDLSIEKYSNLNADSDTYHRPTESNKPNRIRYKEEHTSCIDLNPIKSKSRTKSSTHKKRYYDDDVLPSSHQQIIHHNGHPLLKSKDMNTSTSLGQMNLIGSPYQNKQSKLNRQGVTVTSIPSAVDMNLPDAFHSKSNEIVIEKRRLIKLLKAVNENLDKNEVKELISLYKQEIKAQWTLLSRIIDTLLLIIFTMFTLLLIIYLLTKVPEFPSKNELFW